MNVEEALKVADEAIFATTGKHLTDVQKLILEGSWEKQTYSTIAEKCHCEEQSIKNEGSTFWKLLSKALGEKVTKSNFKSALERREPKSVPKSEVSQPDIEALVQEACQKISPIIQERHGKMKVLTMNNPIEIDEIYTTVNILESITGRKRLNISELAQKFDPDLESFERIGFGKIAEEGIPGKQAVERYSKLMVLGKPGAGKTTFLSYLALQSIQGKLKPQRVPICVTLREFAETKDKLALLNFIIQDYPLSKTEIIKFLQQGRVLLLLDGLDEVKEEDFTWMLTRIKNFIDEFYFSEVYNDDSHRYPHLKLNELCSQFPEKIYSNSFVITCRIAAKDYTLNSFTDVEVADFNETQIKDFVQKWFRVKASENEAKFFMEQINSNPPVKELATNPLLLTLLCIEFEQTGDLPTDRLELYKTAIHTLLKTWDSKRRIKRDEVYKSLFVDWKKNLLSEIAWNTFYNKEYFFKKEDLEGYIAGYIRNLPDTKNDPETLQLDSEAVLKSIESQHGLLVERAKGIYSFSHLTFQEYFAARKVLNSCSTDSMKDKMLNDLATHITEERWREVFLLVIRMLDPADCLLLMIKKEVDRIIADDQELQNLIADLNTKSLSIKAQKKSVFMRVFLLEIDFLPFWLLSHLSLHIFIDTMNYEIDQSGCDEIDKMSMRNRISQLQSTFTMFLWDYFGAKSKMWEMIELSKQLKCNQDILKKIEDWFIRFKKLENNMQQELVIKQMEAATSLFDEIKKNDLVGDLDTTLAEASQSKIIRQYYKSNIFLMECLRSNCSVSPEVREEIEETLLLPIDEIEKWKQQHRPNT